MLNKSAVRERKSIAYVGSVMVTAVGEISAMDDGKCSPGYSVTVCVV